MKILIIVLIGLAILINLLGFILEKVFKNRLDKMAMKEEE